MSRKSHSENRQILMTKPLLNYRAVIFDMDGTLYYQLPLRLRMGGKLAAYYLRHPLRYKELLAVKTFREIRERWPEVEHNDSVKHNASVDDGSSAEQASSLDWRQYCQTAEKLSGGVRPEWIKQTVEHWMYQVPLALLPLCQDRQLAGLIRTLRKRHITVIIYSDYPAIEKARALNIEPDYIFSALDADIMCLKPDPKGLSHILSVTGLSPEQALMVGDRYEKDGMAARNAGIDWMILPSNPKKRNKLLKESLRHVRDTHKD